MHAVALYDCAADDAAELSFHAGDTITDVISADDPGWHVGTLGGVRGLFPGNYVQFITTNSNNNNNASNASNATTTVGNIPMAAPYAHSGPAHTPANVQTGSSQSIQAAQRKMNVQEVRQRMLSRSSQLAANLASIDTTPAGSLHAGAPRQRATSGSYPLGTQPSTYASSNSNITSGSGSGPSFPSGGLRGASQGRSFSAGYSANPQPPPTPHRPPLDNSNQLQQVQQQQQQQVQVQPPPVLPQRDVPQKPAVAKKPSILAARPINAAQPAPAPGAASLLTQDAARKYTEEYVSAGGSSGPAGRIDGSVTRAAWLRSGLNHTALGLVWEAVDTGTKGFLTLAEFVAGRWMIDDTLAKGTQAQPRRAVPDSVWRTAHACTV